MLVSVIMAAYNAEQYIEAAIQSLLAQTHTDWELLVVNDGSKDQTEAKILQFQDPRIRYFQQDNAGVSAARNIALAAMQGDFFLIFDSDDILLPDSLAIRLQVFEQYPDTDFVDGIVVKKDAQLQQIVSYRTPSFTGNPQTALMQLDMRCFSVPSWLIRRHKEKVYQMRVGMTHAEDLLFYIDIARSGDYRYVSKEVLYYRVHATAAMMNYKGLENGYYDFYNILKQEFRPSWGVLLYLKIRIIRIMFLSYLRSKQVGNAFRVVWRFLFL